MNGYARVLILSTVGLVAVGWWSIDKLVINVPAKAGFSPAALLVGALLAIGFWILDKILGVVAEHHAEKFLIPEGERRDYVTRLAAKICEIEEQYERLHKLHMDALDQRDAALKELAELKRRQDPDDESGTER